MPASVTEYARNVSLSVMLIVSRADEAVQWYGAALGAQLLWDLGGVAGLHLDGAPFFVQRRFPGGAPSRARARSG